MKLALLLAVLLIPALARATDFGKVEIEKGYHGPLVVDVVWSDGTARDVTNATGTVTVYATPPRAGVGGTVLFIATLVPAGSPANRLVATILPEQVAVPGSYYAEIVVTEGANVDPVHGTVAITGR